MPALVEDDLTYKQRLELDEHDQGRGPTWLWWADVGQKTIKFFLAVILPLGIMTLIAFAGPLLTRGK